MNKGIAHVLLHKVKNLPFIDLFGGLVSIQEELSTSEDEGTGQQKNFLKKYPVTDDVIDCGNDCSRSGTLVAFIPDSNRKGILYFEDLGVQSLGKRGPHWQYQSSLRLVVWINTKELDTSRCAGLSMPMATKIISALTLNPFNANCFLTVISKINRIPITDKQIFKNYTYDNAVMQYLMPPFEYFALDLQTSFSINPECIDDIQTMITTC